MKTIQELNEFACNCLKIPVQSLPKVTTVPVDSWFYPSVARYEMGDDTIYLKAGETITDEIMVHEVAHSAFTKSICGIVLSGVIQEIVAGYVEYQFRKANGTLTR